MNKPFGILLEAQSRDVGRLLLGFSISFYGFGVATTSALLQILEILSRRKQEEREPHNQDFRAAPAWSVRPGKVELRPGALPGFNC